MAEFFEMDRDEVEKEKINSAALSVGSCIQKISQNLRLMKEMVDVLGTPEDSHELRLKLDMIQRSTTVMVKGTSESVLRLRQYLIPPDPEKVKFRLQVEKLTDELNDVLEVFSAFQRLAYQKETEIVYHRRKNIGNEQHRLQARRSSEDGQIELTPIHQQRQLQLQQEQQQVRWIEEDETSIRELEQDIETVNDIYKKLHDLVHDQGELVDSIEVQTERASEGVSQGAADLQVAKKHENETRMCKLILFALTSLVVLSFITVTYGVVS